MEQLVMEFEDLQSTMVNKGTEQRFNNKKVEVIQPIPLDDLMHIIDSIKDGHDTPKAQQLDSLGRGAFGTVLGYKNYAIKYFRSGQSDWNSESTKLELPESDKLTDAYILKELQSIPSIPRIYAVVDDVAIIMERIDGETCENYEHKVRTSKYKDNYINEDFNKEYRGALEDIVNLGFEPYDLHGHNVMVCRKTGMPKIVDVGLFRKINSEELRNRYQSDEKFDMTPMRQAISWVANSMTPYIERKTNPEKYKALDLQNEIRKAEREAYKEKAERERAERQRMEEEREKRRIMMKKHRHHIGHRTYRIHQDRNEQALVNQYI